MGHKRTLKCVRRNRFVPESDITARSCTKSYQRHICFNRAPTGTVFRGAIAGELRSQIGTGHAHLRSILRSWASYPAIAENWVKAFRANVCKKSIS
jgi:hypothetical protein